MSAMEFGGAFHGMLPVRLGHGFTAAQHARVCADLVAACKTAQFALVKVRSNATIDGYRGMNGDANAPTTTLVTSGPPSHVRLDWPATWVDDYGNTRRVQIRSATVSSQRSDTLADAVVESPTRVSVYFDTGLLRYAHLTVYGSDLDKRTIYDYGGQLDKTDCTTETTPYSWSTYQFLRSDRGSLYSQQQSGLVHLENLAIARAEAARLRDGERVASNSNPLTATEKQDEWRRVLGVSARATDTPDRLRARMKAALIARRGNSQMLVEKACKALLGDLFVQFIRNHTADLTNPPNPTYGDGLETGPAEFDMGAGVWRSARNDLRVELTIPGGYSYSQFSTASAELYELLDNMLPATVTFQIVRLGDGFHLDVDQLNVDALT